MRQRIGEESKGGGGGKIPTVRFTPDSGRKSVAADTKSLPYFFSKTSRSRKSSGISEHLGAANIKLEIPSFRSGGQFLHEEY